MPTKIIAVEAGQDVASFGWDTDHFYFIVDPADTDIGYMTPNVNSQGNALRFLNVPIPPGSTILYAYLKYSAFSNYDVDVVRAYITPEKSLNPQPFSTYADYSLRPRTTERSDWSNIEHWEDSKWYNSIDFTPAIQEVIDQPGWEAGNPIAIFCEDEANRSDPIPVCARHGWAHRYFPEKAPRLHLSWLAPGEEPPAPSPGESYTIGGDALYLLEANHIAGQTFTPAVTHLVQYLDLNLKSSFYTAPPKVQIYLTNHLNEPTGDPLLNITIYPPSPIIPAVSRVRVKIPNPFLLSAGTEYALLCLYDAIVIGTRASWQYDSASATYPRGHRIHSEDSGATWTHELTQDHISCEFGAPPLPQPEPEPPILPFAGIDIRFTPTWFGLLIVLTTATPCHLTCYYTEIKPLKHSVSRTTRGLTVPWSTYFCFTGWHALEQIEPGDTLYHTFDFEEWAICLTRWFTFRGEVDNLQSPSVGPIFKYHHLASPLYEYYNTGDDGEGSIWRLEHRAQTFTPLESHTISFVKLKLFRTGLPGTLTARIYATLNGKPTGAPLCIGTTNADTLPTGPPYEWRDILLTPSYDLISGIKYAMTLKSTGVIAENRVNWRVDCSSPTYPRGEALYSHDGGITWTKVPSCDYMFEEYGI